MTDNQNGKRNALLGGLLVFLVPVLAVSIVYFTASRLPKGKDIPVLQKAAVVGDFEFINGADTIANGTYWKDVKILFWADGENGKERISMLDKMMTFAAEQPEFSLKDPYPQVYLLGLTEEPVGKAKVYPNLFLLNVSKTSPAFADKSRLYLLDRLENIRGEYQFTDADLDLLMEDTQYLLQDTFYDNADSLRIKRLFKTELDEQ